MDGWRGKKMEKSVPFNRILSIIDPWVGLQLQIIISLTAGALLIYSLGLKVTGMAMDRTHNLRS